MPSITFTAFLPDDSYSWLPEAIRLNASSSTTASFRDAGTDPSATVTASIDATGTGFAFRGGTATDGTVTDLAFLDRFGHAVVTMSGLSLDLSEFQYMARLGAYQLQIFLFSGDDVIVTQGSSTAIFSGAGDDDVTATGSTATFLDGGGADTYTGNTAYDTLSYADWLYLPAQRPRGITADLAAGTVRGPDGDTDSVSGIEILRGTWKADVMRGSGAFEETFEGQRGADTIDGRGGFDTVSFAGEQAAGGAWGVTVNLAAGTATDGFGHADGLSAIEGVIGTALDDTIRGSRDANRITGAAGDDRLTGLAGADTFRFGLSFGDDVITDFSIVAGDRIDLSESGLIAGDLTISTITNGVLVDTPEGSILLQGFTGTLSASAFQF